MVEFGEDVELVQSGDINQDSKVDIADVWALVNYLFTDGPAPEQLGLADIDGSCRVDVSDLASYVLFMFHEGSPPQLGCARH